MKDRTVKPEDLPLWHSIEDPPAAKKKIKKSLELKHKGYDYEEKAENLRKKAVVAENKSKDYLNKSNKLVEEAKDIQWGAFERLKAKLGKKTQNKTLTPKKSNNTGKEKNQKQPKKSTPKKEKYSKQWKHIYKNGKPALQHQRSKEVVFPSDSYIKRHHPQGSWDS